MRRLASLLVFAMVGSARGQAREPRWEAPELDRDPPRARVGFREASRRAIEAYPQMRLALLALERAEAALQTARAPAWPRLIANGVYQRLDDDRKLAERVFQPRDQLSANLTLSVPLVAPTAWAQWNRAGHAVDVQRATTLEVRRAVALGAARAYLAVVAQKRIVAAAARSLASAGAHRAFARSRFEGGVGNRLDWVRAEQEFAQAERDAQLSMASLVSARESLGIMLNADGPIDADEQDVSDLQRDIETWRRVRFDESRRADLVAAARRVEAQRSSKRDNYTDFLPTLTGQFVPFYQTPPSVVTPETGWTAQLIASWPLFDGGARYGATKERAVALREAEIQYEASKRQARSEERVAQETIARADAALAAAQRVATHAREALDLAATAYRVGTATNIELVDAERRARDAEANVAITEDTARRARLDALAAAGLFPAP